jgi:hypothetical protein
MASRKGGELSTINCELSTVLKEAVDSSQLTVDSSPAHPGAIHANW